MERTGIVENSQGRRKIENVRMKNYGSSCRPKEETSKHRIRGVGGVGGAQLRKGSGVLVN